MGFPTSSWGQANWSDVYSAIPVGSGLQLGSTELLFDGSFIQFVLFNATTAANKAVTVFGSAVNYSVTPTTAAEQLVVGVSDRAGGGLGGTIVSVAATNYAWITIKGLCYPLCTASTAAGSFMVSTTTSGLLAASTPGTDIQGNVYNTVVVGGSNAASPCIIV